MRYPLTAHYGLVVSLHNEWQHVCRMVPGAGPYMEQIMATLQSFLSVMMQASHWMQQESDANCWDKMPRRGDGPPKPNNTHSNIIGDVAGLDHASNHCALTAAQRGREVAPKIRT